MRAMTCWDHETESIWSQPWGMAIHGPLKGTRLRLIPARIVPWVTWLDDHPDTLVMEVEGRGFGGRESFSERYVIGITLGEHAKAYAFEPASKEEVINDWVLADLGGPRYEGRVHVSTEGGRPATGFHPPGRPPCRPPDGQHLGAGQGPGHRRSPARRGASASAIHYLL